MKKLLLKWFPSFFHVCVHNDVKFEDIKRDRALDVVLLDPESGSITQSLGITDERANELEKQCNIVWLEAKTFTATAELISQRCNHVNEYTFAMYLITKRMTQETIVIEAINSHLGRK